MNISLKKFKETINGASFEMVFVEGGTFMMGNDKGRDSEKPAHKVQLDDFYIGKFPVTQALRKAVMGDNSSYFKGDNCPVERVSWRDVKDFFKKLNEKTKDIRLPGTCYHLPTETQWEYAARGGDKSLGFPYAGSHKLKEVGWYRLNSHEETKPVGLKLPNDLELYDMSGNTWEWCEDVWHENYKDAPEDGSAWMEGGDQVRRVVRGGSWLNDGVICTVSFRSRYLTDLGDDSVGFRLARY